MFSNTAQEILFYNYAIMLWLLILWIFKAFQKRRDPIYLDSLNYYNYKKRTSFYYSLITILPLVLWAGFRPDVEDTHNYRNGFNQLEASFGFIKTILHSDGKGKGFGIFEVLLKMVIGNNDVLFFIIVSGIIVGIVSYVYRRTSVDYSMAMFLYFASSMFYSWNFNGLRQGLAMSLTFLASYRLFERKYIRFAILVFLAFSVHASAIVFLIALFVYDSPPWSRRVMITVLGFAFVLMFLEQFTGILENVLEDTNYAGIVNTIENGTGVKFLRVLVNSIPLIIAIISYKDVNDEGDVVVNYSVNMAFLGVAFYVVAMFTSGLIVGRLPAFFTLWNFVLLSWEIDRMFDKKGFKVLMEIVMVGFYIAFNVYSMTGTMQSQYGKVF